LGALRGSVAALGLLVLGACTVWPPAGSGGFAEHRPAPLPADEADGLGRRLACGLARFERIRAESEASGRLTGRTAATREVAIRARREFAAGLHPDAALSLGRLEAETAAIAVQLPGPARPVPAECA
jgi:hypothetical protein